MHENLTALPEVLNAGTQVTYRRTSSEFKPSGGWTLTLYLAGKSTFSKAFTPVGESHEVTLTAGETGGLTAGNYQWEERASKGGEVYTFACGVLALRPNVATATAGSLESRASKMLAAVRAAIDLQLGVGGTPSPAVDSYTIGDRSLRYVDLKVLLDMEARLALAVKREENPGEWGPQILTHFVKA